MDKKNEIIEYQKWLETNIDYVCENILKIKTCEPDINNIKDYMYPGFFIQKEKKEVFENFIKKSKFDKYRTPPRGNLYNNNIIVSGITPGTLKDYKCESTFLFGIHSTLLVLDALRQNYTFAYYTNVYKSPKIFESKNSKEKILQLKKYIKELIELQRILENEIHVICFGKSYKEFHIVKKFFTEIYVNKVNIHIISHPSYYLRRNMPENFYKEIKTLISKIKKD